MTMPNDPGTPEEPQLDPSLDADLEAALADVADATVDEAGTDLGTEAGAEAGTEAKEEVEAASPTLEEQLAERTEDLQRLNAEYTNYRRRTQREREAAIITTKAQVLSEFLPLLDDLELARQHGDLEAGPLKAFADKLLSTVKTAKLEAFGAEGDTFDPEIHEAVQDLSSGEHKVLGTVLRQGYRVGQRLVRTAMVIIADPAQGEQPDPGTAQETE